MKTRILILAIGIGLSCGHPAAAQYRLQESFPGLTFTQPVDLQNPGDGSGRLFVVEQPGRIQLVGKNGGEYTKQLFLDLTGRVAAGGEMGLLGLAFHPDFASNGTFYVDYTRADPRQSVISRFKLAADPDTGDPLSEEILLTVDQPFSNHNGGQIAFGPDGYLYIALGDGGSGGDPQNNAQNLRSLLGKILRIDVNAAQEGRAYAIPADNPLAGNTAGYREEIYAWGLRNPWRFSFDSAGRLWCGDVGQNQWEEIDLIQKGGNYGWRITEGKHCYNPASGCNTDGLEMPIHEYGHDDQGGFSITGGYLYEGEKLPGLRGRYLFGDFVSQRVWALDYDPAGGTAAVATLLTTAPAGISSFGVDEAGELYLCGYNGRIWSLAPTTSRVGTGGQRPEEFSLLRNYPNPFNPVTTIEFSLPHGTLTTLKVLNLAGEQVALLVDGWLPAGRHSVRWYAGGLAGGIYLGRLQGEGVTADGRFILLK